MAVALAVGAVLLVGCRSTSTPAGTAAPTPTAAGSRSVPPQPRTSRPQAARPAPTPVEGRCPYVDADSVAGTVGQHISRTTVTPTQPHPGCSFYRPNGERAVDIAVSTLSGRIQAQNEAISVGGRAANPVDGLGDGGVVAVTADGAVLAVSKGRTLVVVRINQRSSLEAKEIARYVVGRL
jgi:hypothetical protein